MCTWVCYSFFTFIWWVILEGGSFLCSLNPLGSCVLSVPAFLFCCEEHTVQKRWKSEQRLDSCVVNGQARVIMLENILKYQDHYRDKWGALWEHVKLWKKNVMWFYLQFNYHHFLVFPLLNKNEDISRYLKSLIWMEGLEAWNEQHLGVYLKVRLCETI